MKDIVDDFTDLLVANLTGSNNNFLYQTDLINIQIALSNKKQLEKSIST